MNPDLDRVLLQDTTPEQRHRARLAVVDHATDTDDARRLLDMLGLLEDLT